MDAETLTKWRVPMGWAVGLGALYLAKPRLELYAVGIAIAALGELIRVWAAGHLDKNTRLTTSGPYAWTRNPLYFGSALMGLGFALATGRPVLVFVVGALFAAVYAPVMKREAGRMAETFPAAYPEYAARTPLFWVRPPKPLSDTERFSLARLRRNREHFTVMGWLAVAGLIGWKLL
jgi:protein-S-isoprenylcysteine O-methyltransferase Ste14